MICPVADPVNSRSRGGTSESFSITFSRPMTATCTSGAVVHMRPLPSFSTNSRVPVSAMAKLTPESPTLAAAKRLRSTRLAMAVSSSTSSV
jgi:hypothetical protein